MLNLWLDLTVSRRHATIGRDEGGLWIEDDGSRAGTLLDGRTVRAGRVSFPPGLPIRTGLSTFAIVPEDWLVFAVRDIVFYGPCREILTCALLSGGTPVLGPLVAYNRGPSPTAPETVVFSIPDYADPFSVTVPPIAPGCGTEVSCAGLAPRREALLSLSEPATAQLFANASGDPVLLRVLSLLGFWDWSLARDSRHTLAAFVAPENPVVARVAARARDRIEKSTGVADFEDLARAGLADPEARVLEAVYRTLAEDYSVTWLRPEVGSSPASGPLYQTIRPPHRIVGASAPRDVRGSCLDLCLLAAGALESAGLCPVVVLLGEDADRPGHSVAGCWLGRLPGGQPVIEDTARVRRLVDGGELLLLEWTAAARGAHGHAAPVAEARARAAKRLMEAKYVCAVDVCALRPAIGSVAPLSCDFEPEVARAYAEAEAAAEAGGGGPVETAHLLLGLLRAGGEVMTHLFARAGIDPSRFLWALRAKLAAPRAARGDGVMTRNALTVKSVAENMARVAGSPSVREQDLLWAVLARRGECGRLVEACSAAGFPLDRMSALLEETRPSFWTPDTESPEDASPCTGTPEPPADHPAGE